MKIVSTDETQWMTYPGQRALVISYKGLLQGNPVAPDNYEMSFNFFKTEGGSFSPRHHHNFDQFRWAFDEPLNYAPKQDIPPHHLGYFPEGAYYGPQIIEKGARMLIIQFGGASGLGYMSWDTLNRGTEELKKKGTFQKGYYTYVTDDGRKINKDGYEAVWEHINDRDIAYPVPRYLEPVIINPEAFVWIPVANQSGVNKRELGVFNERGTSAFQFKIQSEKTLTYTAAGGTALLYVLSGKGQAQDKAYGPDTAIEVAPGEVVHCVAAEETIILGFTMPDFSDRMSVSANRNEKRAAELT